jgi:hypothetical protein
MLRCAVVVLAMGSLAYSAAADSVGGLAAPGDCAQPSAGFESPATYEQAATIGGSAADHFAPRVVGDVVGVLPLDLTRTRTAATLEGVTTESVGVVERTVESTAEGVSGALGGATAGVGGTVDRLGDALNTVATDTGSAVGVPGVGGLTEGATSALGGEGLTGDALTGVTGAVDSLTGTATRTTTGVLGGLAK